MQLTEYSNFKGNDSNNNNVNRPSLENFRYSQPTAQRPLGSSPHSFAIAFFQRQAQTTLIRSHLRCTNFWNSHAFYMCLTLSCSAVTSLWPYNLLRNSHLLNPCLLLEAFQSEYFSHVEAKNGVDCLQAKYWSRIQNTSLYVKANQKYGILES